MNNDSNGFWSNILFTILIIIALFLVIAIPGFILMLVLHGFGVNVGYWTCFGIFCLVIAIAQIFKD